MRLGLISHAVEPIDECVVNQESHRYIASHNENQMTAYGI